MATNLTPTMVSLGKEAGSRAGYVDARGQVYLPPKSARREAWWKKRMQERGYKFD